MKYSATPFRSVQSWMSQLQCINSCMTLQTIYIAERIHTQVHHHISDTIWME